VSVAVLGAGIMGATLAVLLARAGHRVTVFDKAPAPLSGASRWNEGKLHLGYLYSADRSGTSGSHMIEGGLAFAGILREVIDQDVSAAASAEPDLYLVHERSVVAAGDMHGYFRRLDAALSARSAAGYVGPIHATEALTRRELDRLDVPGVVAGFRVPERSVDTQLVADRLAEALAAEPSPRS
jgi:glycine/D-amino acid oxidase-like deaminating enzyme